MPTFPAIIQKNVRFTKEIEGHLKVMRIRLGEEIRVTDGRGLFSASVSQVHPHYEAVVLNPLPLPSPPKPIHLHVSLLKNEKLEWIVEKAVELNIQAVHFIESTRSIRVSLSETKQKRLEKIAQAAQIQCGRLIPLMLYPSVSFKKALSEKMEGIHLFCHPSPESKKMVALPLQGPIHIWIGPEGGWEAEEKEAACERGFHLVSLGDLTLRAETAALVAICAFVGARFIAPNERAQSIAPLQVG